MRMRSRRFEVDRAERKLLGVCAGIANHLGIDATIVRIGVVLLALFASFFWTAIAYGALGLAGQARRAGGRAPRLGAGESRERVRAIDLRMRAIETHAASANSPLAREIEALR